MYERTFYVCGHYGCGRVVYPNDEAIGDWLIGERVADPAVLVVFCPQHITERRMRDSGKPLSKANFRWARRAKERDEGSSIPGLIVPLPPDALAAILRQHDDSQISRGNPGKRKKRKDHQ